ncbi:MAG: hypothetical protein MZV64_63130 [Ignavibacteriales bacterium]|nr:hypothetical protein [Ignavibacteriales bacterium]
MRSTPGATISARRASGRPLAASSGAGAGAVRAEDERTRERRPRREGRLGAGRPPRSAELDRARWRSPHPVK